MKIVSLLGQSMGYLCILQALYQTFVCCYMIMIAFYCHLGIYGKIMEHDHDEFLKGSKVSRVCTCSLNFFSFLLQIDCVVIFFNL